MTISFMEPEPVDFPEPVELEENDDETTYIASETLTEFHQSKAFIRAVLGPFGSGKSVGLCWDIIRWTKEMPECIRGPNKGKRVARFLVTRNTYGELLDTTCKTWWEWFPKNMGNWQEAKMTHTIEFEDCILEVLFRALDRPDHVAKLLSLELTGAWMNEAREQPLPIFEGLQGRVGRYPPLKNIMTDEELKEYGDAVELAQIGEGPEPEQPYYNGIMIDTNMPDEDHWIAGMLDPNMPVPSWANYSKMTNVDLWIQPSGLSKDAENLRNLKPGYYKNLMQGKSPEWINVYIHAKYGFIIDGKAVYEEYQPHIHEDDSLVIEPGYPVFVGIDFGLTPAATFRQYVDGQWRVLREIVTQRMSVELFADEIKQMYSREFGPLGCSVGSVTGDPAGMSGSQTRDEDCFRVLAAKGVTALPAYTNDYTIRREAVAQPMLRLQLGGNPSFVVGPECKMLRKAYRGGYQFKRMQVVGQARFQDKPDKNMYSHVAEADQYCALGAGAGTPVTESPTAEAEHKMRRRKTNVKRSIHTGRRT